MKRNFLFMRIVSILMDMVGVILVIDSIMSFGIRTKNLYIGLGIFLFGLVLWVFLGIAEDVNRLANGKEDSGDRGSVDYSRKIS